MVYMSSSMLPIKSIYKINHLYYIVYVYDNSYWQVWIFRWTRCSPCPTRRWLSRWSRPRSFRRPRRPRSRHRRRRRSRSRRRWENMGNFGNFTLEIEEITVKNVPSGYVKRLKFENKNVFLLEQWGFHQWKNWTTIQNWNFTMQIGLGIYRCK